MVGRLAAAVVGCALGIACADPSAPPPELPPDGVVEPAAGTLLEDLPPRITELVALETIAGTLPAAQLEVIDYFLKDEATTAAEAAILERSKDFLEVATTGDEKPPDASPQRLEKLGISVVDPRPVARRLAERRREIEAAECPRMRLVEGDGRSVERHNLIVFYVRTVLTLCGEPVDWRPSGGHRGIEAFHALFDSGEYYKHLDSYLEDPNNEPFMRRNHLFLAIYFQYLELAFKARVIDFPRREFLDRRLDLRESYPELRYLSEYFAVMVRGGLAG